MYILHYFSWFLAKYRNMSLYFSIRLWIKYLVGANCRVDEVELELSNLDEWITLHGHWELMDAGKGKWPSVDSQGE